LLYGFKSSQVKSGSRGGCSWFDDGVEARVEEVGKGAVGVVDVRDDPLWVFCGELEGEDDLVACAEAKACGHRHLCRDKLEGPKLLCVFHHVVQRPWRALCGKGGDSSGSILSKLGEEDRGVDADEDVEPRVLG